MSIRLLRRPEVEKLTGLSRSSIYALMDRGEFPRPRRIGQRAVGWDEATLERWLATRAEAKARAGGGSYRDPQGTNAAW